jgi:hypothetical protein
VYGAELVGANWSEDPVPTEPPRGEPLVIDGEAERIGEVNN